MKRFATVLGLAVSLSLVAGAGTAWASWTTSGAGSGTSKAIALPTGPTPTVSVTGRNVVVSWSQVNLPNATPVTAYQVGRFSTANVAQTIGSACSGTVNALTCTEAAVPAGTWKYTASAKRSQWVGTQSSYSSNVVVAAPSLSFSSSTTINTLAATLNGTIASYVTGETITFRLDNATSGTVLSSTVTTSPIPFSGTSTFSVTIPTGITAGAHTVYAVGSAGSQSSAGITVNPNDTVAPTVSAATIAKTAGGVDGYVKQGGTYYVYAQVTDTGSPATGVSTVRANVSAVTTGATNVTLTAGSYTADGVSYNYRSASQTASNPLSATSKAFTITATDVGGNSGTTSGFSVTVDNTVPTGTNIQTTNVSGGTTGRAETGDTITFTFSEAMEPNSILAGWTGAATPVTLRLVQNGGGDRVQIRNAADSAALPFGTAFLNQTGLHRLYQELRQLHDGDERLDDHDHPGHARRRRDHRGRDGRDHLDAGGRRHRLGRERLLDHHRHRERRRRQGVLAGPGPCESPFVQRRLSAWNGRVAHVHTSAVLPG